MARTAVARTNFEVVEAERRRRARLRREPSFAGLESVSTAAQRVRAAKQTLIDLLETPEGYEAYLRVCRERLVLTHIPRGTIPDKVGAIAEAHEIEALYFLDVARRSRGRPATPKVADDALVATIERFEAAIRTRRAEHPGWNPRQLRNRLGRVKALLRLLFPRTSEHRIEFKAEVWVQRYQYVRKLERTAARQRT